MRVDIAKLDSLMGILGEIHISKSAFGRIAGELRAMQGSRASPWTSTRSTAGSNGS